MILAVALVLLFWTLWFAWPYIRRWLMRRGMNYVQDRMYKSMGIDPAQMRQAQREAEKTAAGRGRSRTWRRPRTGRKIIPPGYGETVSFEELSLSGDEKWLSDTDKSPVYTEYSKETQITDAQYVIIP